MSGPDAGDGGRVDDTGSAGGSDAVDSTREGDADSVDDAETTAADPTRDLAVADGSADPESGKDAEGEADADDGGQPTPQSAALRRQQRYIGVGGAILGGLALATGTFQRFPDTPALAAVAGLAGTAVVLWLARRSIFPGEPVAGE